MTTQARDFKAEVAELFNRFPDAMATFVQNARGALSLWPYTLVQVYDNGVIHPVAITPVDDALAEEIVEMVQAHNEILRPDDADNECCFCGRKGNDSLCDVHRYLQQREHARDQQRVGDAAVAQARSTT